MALGRAELSGYLNTTLHSHCIELVGSRIYVSHGYFMEPAEFNVSTFFYDVRKNRWDQSLRTGEHPSQRTVATLTLIGDRLFLIGGKLWLENAIVAPAAVYCLDLALNEWQECETKGMAMPALCGHVAEYFDSRNELLLISSGTDETPRKLRSVLAMTPDTYTLYKPRIRGEQPKLLPYPAAYSTAQTVFLFGGKDFGNGNESANDMYLLHVNASWLQWSVPRVTGAVPAPRRSSQLTLFHGKLVLFGGRNNERFMGDMHVYDPHTSEWHAVQKPGYNEPLAGHLSVASKNKVYMIGGGRGDYDTQVDLAVHKLESVLVLSKKD